MMILCNQNQRKEKKSKNWVSRYPCVKCEYSATRAGELKRHSDSKHEGVRYPCDKCEYAATTAR